jgi:hypothetical protein
VRQSCLRQRALNPHPSPASREMQSRRRPANRLPRRRGLRRLARESERDPPIGRARAAGACPISAEIFTITPWKTKKVARLLCTVW